MNHDTKDDKLETFISKIKTSKNSSNKLINYNRATNRLNELKTEYNTLCDALKPKHNKKSSITEEDFDDEMPTKTKKSAKKPTNDTTEKISIDKITSELNRINSALDNGSDNMIELIDNYVQYKLLILSYYPIHYPVLN